MAVSKPFTVRKGKTIQFLSEFFNTINHPQFANPSLKRAVETFLASVSPV
jgi:hypothetical protein